MDLMAAGSEPREAIPPTRGPVASAALAASAAPVALQQSRILQTAPQQRLQ
jgi:hypothetical protein